MAGTDGEDAVLAIEAADAGESLEAPAPDDDGAAPSIADANKHAVKALAAECNGLIARINQAGAGVDLDRLKTISQVMAIGRILLAAGLCTEAQLQYEEFLATRGFLRGLLQHVEGQALAKRADAKKVEAVRAPKLLIARH
jgi:hypothetical protein